MRMIAKYPIMFIGSKIIEFSKQFFDRPLIMNANEYYAELEQSTKNLQWNAILLFIYSIVNLINKKGWQHNMFSEKCCKKVVLRKDLFADRGQIIECVQNLGFFGLYKYSFQPNI